MTEQDWLELKEKDILFNPRGLVPGIGPAIAPGTKHIVIRVVDNQVLQTQTLGDVHIQCAFDREHALQLLQKYETPCA